MDHPRQGDSVAGVRSLIVRVARWQNIAGSRSSAGVRPASGLLGRLALASGQRWRKLVGLSDTETELTGQGRSCAPACCRSQRHTRDLCA